MAKLSELHVQHCLLEDKCPRCGEEVFEDWGQYELDEDEVGGNAMNASFVCGDCGIEWYRDMRVVFKFGRVRDIEEVE